MRSGKARGRDARYSARGAGFRESPRDRSVLFGFKATTRAERATSVRMLGKMSSSIVVDTHQSRDKVGSD